MSGPLYTYTMNTPESPNPMNATQPLILNNFKAINEFINVNHVGFNINNFGKHNVISMPNQTSNPITNSTEIAMFTKATGSPNPSEIFIEYPDSLASYQISNQSLPYPASGTSGGTASQGWCLFPSGVLFRWGTFSLAINTNPQAKLTLSTGPQYKQGQQSSAIGPTSYGCLLPTAMTIYTGLPSGTPQTIYLQLNGATSTSIVVNFNYLLMGI